MERIPFNEMAYEQIVEAIDTRHPNLEAEIRRMYVTATTSSVDLWTRPGSYHEWESKFITTKDDPIGPDIARHYKTKILDEVIKTIITPYLTQHEPARQLVELYMMLGVLCENWGLNPSLIRERLQDYVKTRRIASAI